MLLRDAADVWHQIKPGTVTGTPLSASRLDSSFKLNEFSSLIFASDTGIIARPTVHSVFTSFAGEFRAEQNRTEEKS
ncbi:Hypothetical predicted protein [Olea europaea subsp. europaea]|uniref:Uncharacterized protein n=1 Tax=Olea europaea subsp. europaea TaxID=158383 RepID=A0A8S0VDT3_OLEEU|nr:Hypothetical predicted protein [Olea europaea subsp. europaea]